MAWTDPYDDRGYWVNVQNRYLGLKLVINGQSHYGWARFSVRAEKNKVTALLTRYAYEATANQPILAGMAGLTSDSMGRGAGVLDSSGTGAAEPSSTVLPGISPNGYSVKPSNAAFFTNEPNTLLKEKLLPFLESGRTQYVAENRQVAQRTQHVDDSEPLSFKKGTADGSKPSSKREPPSVGILAAGAQGLPL